jgi:hypothetical protein
MTVYDTTSDHADRPSVGLCMSFARGALTVRIPEVLDASNGRPWIYY